MNYKINCFLPLLIPGLRTTNNDMIRNYTAQEVPTHIIHEESPTIFVMKTVLSYWRSRLNVVNFLISEILQAALKYVK